MSDIGETDTSAREASDALTNNKQQHDGASEHDDIGLALSQSSLSPSPAIDGNDIHIIGATDVEEDGPAAAVSVPVGTESASEAVHVSPLVSAATAIVIGTSVSEDSGTAEASLTGMISEIESGDDQETVEEECNNGSETAAGCGSTTDINGEGAEEAASMNEGDNTDGDQATNNDEPQSTKEKPQHHDKEKEQDQQEKQKELSPGTASSQPPPYSEDPDAEASASSISSPNAAAEASPEAAETAVNYPTALEKTLQLMAQQTDINTTEYTPSNSIDMRYHGPSATAPNRMPGLSSLPAMFTESQPALFDMGQVEEEQESSGGVVHSSHGADGGIGHISGSFRRSRRGRRTGGRLVSARGSPIAGGDAGSDSERSGIIIEETDEEEYDGGDGREGEVVAEDVNGRESRLEARIDDLERMLTGLTQLLLQKEQVGAISPAAAAAAATAAAAISGGGSITGDIPATATPARIPEEARGQSPTTPAAPDLSHSNVLPLDSPSPDPRRRAATAQSNGDSVEGHGKIPSPPRLDVVESTGTPSTATKASDATPMHQPTPDLSYRSYSQDQVDALWKRREAGVRRAYSFDVAEQLTRDVSLEVARAASPPATTPKDSSRKPRLSPVPPSPSLGEEKGENASDQEEDVQRPPLAPRPDSGPLKRRPSTDKGPDLLPRLSLRKESSPSNEKKMQRTDSTESERELKKKNSSRELIKPPSRTNSSSSLSSMRGKGKHRSVSIASSTDGTAAIGSTRKSKKSSLTKANSSVPSTTTKATPMKQKSSGENDNSSSSSTLKSLRSPEMPGRQTMISYLKKEMMIHSTRQEGSAADDVDANMEEFLRIPAKLERLLFFGFWICTDAFLYVLTFLPLKFLWSCICLMASIIRPGKGFGDVSFHRRHLYQILNMSVVLVVYHYVLMPISIGKLYHWIRGQAMLKLYVLIAIVEVFDRLLCSVGQDAHDSLYWNCTRRPYHPRMVVSTIVVLIYATLHSLLLFLHVATLNVAMNSNDHALLTLIISGNFAEIKSTVFKKYNKQNLFKITTSDVCERFKLALFLLIILILNCFQGGMNTAKIIEYMRICGIVLVAELKSDWIKHSFITKFNFIKSNTYPEYALILAGDLTGIGHEGIDLNHTHAVVKRLGFSQLPVVCVMLRFLYEAVRYAFVFSHGDTEYFFNTFAFWYSEGRWGTLAGLMLGVFLLTLVTKIILGFALIGVARRMLEGPAYVPPQEEKSGGGMSTSVKAQKESNTKK